MRRPLHVLVAAIAAQLVLAPQLCALPAPVRATLANGLPVIVVPTSRLPLVDFRLVARAGALNDPTGKEGLASLAADLLTQGAGRRTAKQLAEDIEFVGGSLNASCGSEQFVVSCEVLKKDLALGLELFRDVIVAPTFAAEEFARKQEETLGQIASDKSEPSVIAENSVTEFFWGASPLGHRPVGHEASVKALTREDVVDFHHRLLVPERSVLVVVGDVQPRAFIAQLEQAFANCKRTGLPPASDGYSAAPPLHGRTLRIVDKPEATQAQIRMMCPSVPRAHPDWYAMQVANTILGDGFTSRLVNSIRVEKGLTYSIRSSFVQYRAAGAFRVSTFTRNDQLRACMDAVLAEVKKLVDEGPTGAELEKSKNYLVGQYPLGLQAPDDLAAEIANVQFHGLDPGFIDAYGGRMRAVTMDDVRRVLKSYFCTDDLKILVVTNGDVGRKALAGLGAIEVKPID